MTLTSPGIEGDYDEIVGYIDDNPRNLHNNWFGSHGTEHTDDIVYMRGMFTVMRDEHPENCPCILNEWDYSPRSHLCSFKKMQYVALTTSTSHIGMLLVDEPDNSHKIRF